MNSRDKAALKYINWKNEAIVTRLNNDAFAEKYDEIKVKGIRVTTSNTKRLDFAKPFSYNICQKGNYKELYVFEKPGKYSIYTTNGFDNDKNKKDSFAGATAIKTIKNKFAERTKLGLKAFSTAFGTTEEDIKGCVPKQLYYIDRNRLGKVIKGVGSIDATSHYPSNMCGRLPTSKDSVTLQGTVLPNEEYPFAFYIKSGHSAEYGVYDTHTWVGSELAVYLFENLNRAISVPRDEDITVLMKASSYELTPEWNHFFNVKKTFPKDSEEYISAKLVMNAAIGMMHTKKYEAYKYSHLVTVALARANNKHLNMIEKIGIGNVLHVCVDGIIYQSPYIYGKTGSCTLGDYEQEFINCQIAIRSTNCYIVKDGDNVVKVKHGAYNRNIDGTHIDSNKVINFEDMYNWVRIDPLKEII